MTLTAKYFFATNIFRLGDGINECASVEERSEFAFVKKFCQFGAGRMQTVTMSISVNVVCLLYTSDAADE